MTAKIPRLARLKALSAHRPGLHWQDGTKATIDLSADVARVAGLKPLRDVREFSAAALGEGGHSAV